MTALSGDVFHQAKLREDFRRRRVHPSVEVRVWEYALGKPTSHVELSANVSVDQRLAVERELLRQNLDVHELETLVAESEALVQRALAAAQKKTAQGLPGGGVDDVSAQGTGSVGDGDSSPRTSAATGRRMPDDSHRERQYGP